MDKKEGKEGKILTMLCAKNTSSKNRNFTTFGVDPKYWLGGIELFYYVWMLDVTKFISPVLYWIFGV